MGKDQNSLEQQLTGKVLVNKQLCSLVVARMEPLRVLQGLKWDVSLIRAELTALRQMLEAKGGFELTAYQKRFMDVLDQYNGLIQEQLAVIVLEDGTIIEGAKSSKLWKN